MGFLFQGKDPSSNQLLVLGSPGVSLPTKPPFGAKMFRTKLLRSICAICSLNCSNSSIRGCEQCISTKELEMASSFFKRVPFYIEREREICLYIYIHITSSAISLVWIFSASLVFYAFSGQDLIGSVHRWKTNDFSEGKFGSQIRTTRRNSSAFQP